MPPFIVAAIGAATLVLAFRALKDRQERAALRQEATKRRQASVETLVRDPETGVYRPSRRG